MLTGIRTHLALQLGNYMHATEVTKQDFRVELDRLADVRVKRILSGGILVKYIIIIEKA